jgi:hypothetical protein
LHLQQAAQAAVRALDPRHQRHQRGKPQRSHHQLGVDVRPVAGESDATREVEGRFLCAR